MRHTSALAVIAALVLSLLSGFAQSAGTQRLTNSVVDRSSADVVRLREEISRSPSTVIDLSTATARNIEPVIRDSTLAISLRERPLVVGQVRIKPLSAKLDSATRKLVLQKVDRDPDATTGALPASVFNGAVEMLSSESEPLTLRAVALADRALRYNAERKVFEGVISVGVVEIESSGKQVQLSAPVPFQVIGVTARPEEVSATSTAPPFEKVQLEVANPASPFKAQIWSVLDPSGGVELEVPVDKPQLSVTASPEKIQGWGFQKASVLVQASNITGGGLSLQVSTTQGDLHGNSIQLDADGLGVIELRSASTGTATISVAGAPFETASALIQFVFPLAYLLAALIGGAAGGLLWSARHRGNVKRMMFEMLVAIVTGAIVFGLFVLGVNVTGFALPAQAGEVLVFVVSALGAFGGTKLIAPRAAGADPEPGDQ